MVVVVYPLAPTEIVTGLQRGSILLPPAVMVYEPGGSENSNAPVASEFPVAKRELDPVRCTAIVVAYGRSAHCGSGGMRSTGHVGPSEIVPRTPELYGKMLPPPPPGVVVVAVTTGHSANSQLGPERPTAEPSGQSFASMVHAFSPIGACTKRVLAIHSPPTTINTIVPMIGYLFIPLSILLFKVEP